MKVAREVWGIMRKQKQVLPAREEREKGEEVAFIKQWEKNVHYIQALTAVGVAIFVKPHLTEAAQSRPLQVWARIHGLLEFIIVKNMGMKEMGTEESRGDQLQMMAMGRLSHLRDSQIQLTRNREQMILQPVI